MENRKLWIWSGVAGVAGIVCYIVAITVPWPDSQFGTSSGLLVVSAWPVLNIISMYGLYTFVAVERQSMANRLAFVFAALAFVVGVVVLMSGAVTKTTWVGVVGFVVMLVSAYVALSSWRGQHRTPEPTRTAEPGAHPSFSVIDGGRSSRKRSLRGSRSSSSHGSMMERFEERWRRRREQNGF